MAPRPGAAPLPPFQRWSFREERYIQWLADMQAAHLTLEAAVADAAAVAATEHYGALISKPLPLVHHYMQWLADMQVAHLTLEATVANAAAVAATEHYSASPP